MYERLWGGYAHKYIVSLNPVVWMVILILIVITDIAKRLMSKEKKVAYKACHIINECLGYLVLLEIANATFYGMYNLLH